MRPELKGENYETQNVLTNYKMTGYADWFISVLCACIMDILCIVLDYVGLYMHYFSMFLVKVESK